MTDGMYRIGIVGASSLGGKELSDELSDSLLAASDFSLLDADEVAGTITAAGEEASLIQPIQSASFKHLDFVFFSGSAETTRQHWKNALRAGAGVVDLTYALENEPGILVRAPWVQHAPGQKTLPGVAEPDLKTPGVVSAHPAAVMLALIAHRLQAKLPLRDVAATLMEPASEYGREAMDELHQQTVNLLSFHALPREQYDAQVSFNLMPALGTAAKVKLDQTSDRIRRHFSTITGGKLPDLALQLIQAPVFHGYVASVLIDFAEPVTTQQIESALAGDNIDIVSGESDPPSNLSAAGQEDIMVRVTSEPPGAGTSTRFWLWLAADNLKLAALNSIACALELRRLRPTGKVQ